VILVSHPTGNTNVRAVLTALEQAEMLSCFQTTVAAQTSDWYLHLLPKKLRSELLRRSYDVPKSKIVTRPYRELIRLGASKLQINFFTQHEIGWASIDSVYRSLDSYVARRLSIRYSQSRLSAVYCYEDAALQTFKAAKILGLKCFYDLPIGYWRMGHMIQQEEAKLNPEWASTLQANFDSPEKLARKDNELQLSDVIFVASSFTKQTLQLAFNLKAPIICIPYGAPLVKSIEMSKPSSQKLRVLFVGSLSQRKGISYLLDAVNLLGSRIELTLIGRTTGYCPPLEKALKTHHWIPSLPHYKILEEMQRHDVFVFPSLFEGFGLVILEAMSQGLPVITTSHTAGPDVITDAKDGFIVPIRSAEAIAAKLDLLASDRTLLLEMSQAAQQKASQFSWKKYGESLVETINTCL